MDLHTRVLSKGITLSPFGFAKFGRSLSGFVQAASTPERHLNVFWECHSEESRSNKQSHQKRFLCANWTPAVWQWKVAFEFLIWNFENFRKIPKVSMHLLTRFLDSNSGSHWAPLPYFDDWYSDFERSSQTSQTSQYSHCAPQSSHMFQSGAHLTFALTTRKGGELLWKHFESL